MPSIILFDDSHKKALQPLTYTRPVAALRVGILTLREKWMRYTELEASYFTAKYLNKVFPTHYSDDNILISGSLLPTPELVEEILALQPSEVLVHEETPIALRVSEKTARAFFSGTFSEHLVFVDSQQDIVQLRQCSDIFGYNAQELVADFELLTKGRESQVLSPSNTLIGPREQLFIEEGAQVEGATLNTQTDPIYIGRNATIMEGSLVRGAFALCDNAVLKLGAKVYGATTLGPYSKVGGEVNNVVFIGYSNKGHDGFLGNSVLGAWCNLGADTNSSNLKNNYSTVRTWSYVQEDFVDSGKQFVGLVMGDHSKCGINTMFNTGTVVGVSANIFGGDFPPKFIPSFAWGSAKGFDTYRLEQALEVAERVMQRRSISLCEEEAQVLRRIFKQAKIYRTWEKE